MVRRVKAFPFRVGLHPLIFFSAEEKSGRFDHEIRDETVALTRCVGQRLPRALDLHRDHGSHADAGGEAAEHRYDEGKGGRSPRPRARNSKCARGLCGLGAKGTGDTESNISEHARGTDQAAEAVSSPRLYRSDDEWRMGLSSGRAWAYQRREKPQRKSSVQAA